MGLISDKIDALRQFKHDMFNNIRFIVEKYDYIIGDMNAQDQLYERGINRNNEELMSIDPYKDITVQIKRFRGQPYDRVTLRDEGDFHRSINVTARHNEFEIYATDIKTESLIRKYGDDMLGLTDDNIIELTWEYIYPELYERLTKSLST